MRKGNPNNIYLLKVNNKNTRTMSMFHYYALSKRPKTFEQVNVSWDDFRDERASTHQSQKPSYFHKVH